MNLILLHGQFSIEIIILFFIVLGLIVGILTSIVYTFIISFYPNKKVKTKEIFLIMGTVMVLSIAYLIFLISV